MNGHVLVLLVLRDVCYVQVMQLDGSYFDISLLIMYLFVAVFILLRWANTFVSPSRSNR